MWEEWRYEIDRSHRSAQLAQDKWQDHEARAELAAKAESQEGSREFDVTALKPKDGHVLRDLPTSWRIRLGRSARPVL